LFKALSIYGFEKSSITHSLRIATGINRKEAVINAFFKKSSPVRTTATTDATRFRVLALAQNSPSIMGMGQQSLYV